MLHTKQFYKDLPKHNGFKWFGYDQDMCSDKLDGIKNLCNY